MVKGIAKDKLLVAIRTGKRLSRQGIDCEEIRVIELSNLDRNLASQLLRKKYCCPANLNKQFEICYSTSSLLKLCKRLGEKLSFGKKRDKLFEGLTPSFFRHQVFAEIYQSGQFSELEALQIVSVTPTPPYADVSELVDLV